MRRCTICKIEKEDEFFIKDHRNKDGRGAQCRDCNNEGLRNKFKESRTRKCLHCGQGFININRFSVCSTKCNILRKINKVNDCWEWQGAYLGIYGWTSYKGKSMLVHRVSYMVFKGEIPKGLCVCHTCDNPKCINPDHLWVGTHKENTDDMIAKGRSNNPKGSRVWNCVLDEKKVLEMRSLRKEGFKIKDIASKYGIKYYTCLDAVTGRRWKHL